MALSSLSLSLCGCLIWVPFHGSCILILAFTSDKADPWYFPGPMAEQSVLSVHMRDRNQERHVRERWASGLVQVRGTWSTQDLLQILIAVGEGCRSCEGFIRHRPPGPHLESPSPSPPQGSIWHRFNIDSTSIRHRNRVESGNRCRIDVKSMPNRPLRRGGRGGFEGGVRGPCA